jgi:predicted nuclease with TOPRIM domain
MQKKYSDETREKVGELKAINSILGERIKDLKEENQRLLRSTVDASRVGELENRNRHLESEVQRLETARSQDQLEISRWAHRTEDVQIEYAR